jgi:hypothetical protein
MQTIHLTTFFQQRTHYDKEETKMHFNTKENIRTRKKEKWILLQKQTLDKQGCPLYYKKLKNNKKMEFVVIQTTTRKNKNEF